MDSPEDIRQHFSVSLDYSIEGKVIIEKFITGLEVSVNGYMADGELVFAAISDRYAFEEYPGGIIKEHILPSQRAKGQTADEVRDLVNRASKKLGITNGPCYCQIMIGEDGHPYMIEIAPRLDGCHMWRLIRYSCGVDLLDWCFRHLLEGTWPGDATAAAEAEAAMRHCRLTFMSGLTGSTVDRNAFDLSDADYVCWYYETGDTVRKLNGYIEKCGYMICPNR